MLYIYEYIIYIYIYIYVYICMYIYMFCDNHIYIIYMVNSAAMSTGKQVIFNYFLHINT